MSSDLLALIAAIGGIFLFIGGLFYFIHWAQMKLEESFHRAARLAGLRRIDTEADEGWKVKSAYEGTLDGARVRLCLGQKIASAGGTDVPISGVLLESEYSRPLPFEIELRRNAGVVPQNYRHPDEVFHKQCAIQTSDPAATERFLDDPALRQSLAQFLKEGQGSALVDRRALFTVLFDARQVGPQGVLRKMRSVASLSKSVGERAGDL